MRLFFLILTLSLLPLPPLCRMVQAATERPVPVVVELFTSQNCAECISADTLIAEIAHNPDSGLIVLSCHVTLWDHRGWKDTLSHDDCAQRQRDYAALLEQGRTFTPQIVVNGGQSFEARHAALDTSIQKSRLKDKIDPIAIDMTPDGFTVRLPELPAGQRIGYALTALVYDVNHSVAITGGENRGKTIVYAHAVSDIIRLDLWQGAAEARLLKRRLFESDRMHGLVILAQAVPGGKIRAAGEYRIYFN